MDREYTNWTLKGPTQEDVLLALRGRRVYVSPTVNSCTVAYDRRCERDYSLFIRLGRALSRRFGCPVLSVEVHDHDDFRNRMRYELHQVGELVGVYDSEPSYFDPSGEPERPEGGDANTLCSAFGRDNALEVANVLRRASFDPDAYPTETARHAELVRALGLLTFAVGHGYGIIEKGQLPEGLTTDDLKHPDPSGAAAASTSSGSCAILRHLLGYLFGFTIFLVAIPSGLHLLSAELDRYLPVQVIPYAPVRISLALLLVIIGLGFVLTSNVWLLLVGKGGPADGFGVQISPRSQRLVTSGPYRYTRNPMAFGAGTFYLGIAVYQNSMVCLAAVAALFMLGPIYLKRIEEKRLERDFGEEYQWYQRSVSLLVPWPPRRSD